MNKKVVMQVGCFLVMFALEMIAAYVDPASVMHSALLVLALLMIPVFVVVGRKPVAIKDNVVNVEESMAKAA